MKILHVITRLILGGAQQNTLITCAGQVQAGHRVWLAYGPIYGPEGSLLDEALATGAELVRIRGMRRAVLPLHDVRSYWALRWLIRKIRPDVVHTHSSKAGIIGRAAAWHERVPAVVHTIHGLPFHERNPAFVNGLYLVSERWASQHCHRLIAITQGMRAAFLEQRIGRTEQFTIIPSAMNVDEFDLPPQAGAEARRELNIPPNAPVVGIVSRLDKLKGQDDLLDILPALQRAHPQVRLLFVGDGWHRAALERRVETLAAPDRVIFTGLLPPSRVPPMLAAMDVHALPSYQEGQSRTMVQALLTGCPIVGYDVGGIGDVCIEGETGRLVPLGDKQALAAAIVELLSDPGERRRLGAQGRAFARERFNHHLMLRQIAAVYEEVLSRRSP